MRIQHFNTFLHTDPSCNNNAGFISAVLHECLEDDPVQLSGTRNNELVEISDPLC